MLTDIGDVTLVTMWHDKNNWQAIAYVKDGDCLIPVESGNDTHFLIELLAYDISQKNDLVVALQDSYYNATIQVNEVGYYNASI
jgi:hypothetical protein